MSAGLPEHAKRKLIEAAKESAASGLPFDDAAPDADAVANGRYRIVRELGRGAMGIVYEAEDLQLLRKVALKVLPPPSRLDAALRERFVREAHAVAKLSHPNIAAVYDATPNAIAMQLVNGGPLSALPRGDVARIVRLVHDAALAVQHAHEQGIIHRDLKPQNLLVEGDRVLVTDFGLAKSAAFDSTLSFSGHLIGTPSYMAPEQAEGRVHDVDAQTDVWGLGATLYAVLAGRPPFEGRELVDVLRRIAEDDPPPLRGILPRVPRDLECVVAKSLEKDKTRRYASALALADDLSRFLRGEPVLARPASLSYKAGRFVQRRPAVAALALVSAIAVAVLGMTLWNRRSERAAADDAMSLSLELFSMIEDAGVHMRLGDTQEVRERVEEGIAACRRFLAEHGDNAHVHYLLGKLLRRVPGRTAEACQALDRALEIDPSLVEARLERGLLLAADLSATVAGDSRPAAVDDVNALSPAGRAMHGQAVADLKLASEASSRLSIVDATFARAQLDWLRGDRLAARRGYEEVDRLDKTHVEAKLALSRLEAAEGNGAAAFKLAMSALDLYRGFGPAYVARAAPFGTHPPPRSYDAVDWAAAQHAAAAAESRITGGDRSADALLARGTARLRLDDVEGALADLTAAVESDPTDAMVRANRGLVRARRAARVASAGNREAASAEWDAAISDYSESLVIAPGVAGVLNNRGVARLEKARLLDALGSAADAEAERARAGADFDAAIEAAPRFALARLNRGILRRREAEHHVFWRAWTPASESVAAGLADVTAALELNTDDTIALTERGRLLELGLECARHAPGPASRPESR